MSLSLRKRFAWVVALTAAVGVLCAPAALASTGVGTPLMTQTAGDGRQSAGGAGIDAVCWLRLQDAGSPSAGDRRLYGDDRDVQRNLRLGQPGNSDD